MRRVELYALFVEGWALREVGRSFPQESEQQRARRTQLVLAFCQQLAFEMFLRSKVTLFLKDLPSVDQIKGLKLQERLELKKQALLVDTWAVELFKNSSVERGCSLLRKSNDSQ